MRTLAAIDIGSIKPDNLPKGWGELFTPTTGPQAGVPGAIPSVLTIIISISGVIFIILLIIGGFMYLTGAGNEEQTGKAKKLMLDAIIGLILTLIAWAAGNWIYGELTKN